MNVCRIFDALGCCCERVHDDSFDHVMERVEGQKVTAYMRIMNCAIRVSKETPRIGTTTDFVVNDICQFCCWLPDRLLAQRDFTTI